MEKVKKMKSATTVKLSLKPNLQPLSNVTTSRTPKIQQL